MKLKDRVVVMNQVTGDVLMEIPYPKIHQFTSLSMNLHTGRASAVWAIVLAIASINILFFIWSGFVITFKRRANRVRNKYNATNSKYIILVGSENGSSFRYAKAIHEQLIKNGHSCFLTELNNYTSFPQAEQLIIVTATYGLGNPPTNATKFIQRLEKYPQTQPIRFSVVGFGSHAYPDFCKFAFEVNNLLAKQTWATPLLEIHTVNDRSPVEFGIWADFWSQKAGVPIDLSQAQLNTAPENLQEFSVISKQIANTEEPSFLLQLQPSQKTNFSSGDLLAIYPANDHRERLYSAGKVNGYLQLSVKLHTHGLGSSYLHALEAGTSIQARIVTNEHFHFPAKAPMVIMVANGTGIAPFLGMINENSNKTDCRLYCGFREAASFELYINKLEEAVSLQQLKALHIAYSREGAKQYVSHLLQRDADSIAAALANGAVIMLCGSLSMQKDVIALLETICIEKNNRPVSYYQSHGQVLMDCY
ncbi:NADPH cytochrome P450 oxidoreductase family protein [Ferruginibacter sp.]